MFHISLSGNHQQDLLIIIYYNHHHLTKRICPQVHQEGYEIPDRINKKRTRCFKDLVDRKLTLIVIIFKVVNFQNNFLHIKH